jgi:methyl-accepting chemotaxis protein/hemerythrin
MHMQLLKWSPELELGLEHIDNQHRQLIGIINELNIAIEYNQPNSVMLPLVERLQAYARSHFKAEEEIFTTYNYTDRIAHEAEHETFISSVQYIRRQCELIDTPMSTKIRDFLLGWLCNHIKTKDMEYKRFIDKAPAR